MLKNKMTMEDKVQKLLQPRYEVIADYPKSEFKIGEILLWLEDNSRVYRPLDNFYYYTNPTKYPAIFRKLSWWERREESEMPEYIKGVKGYFNNKVFKIAHPSQDGREWHIDNEIEHRTFIRYANDFEPITESDYLTFINKPK